jgi:hypothetical protein
MRRPRLAGLAAALILLGTAPAPAAEPYRDRDHGYTVQLPPRWEPVSAELVGGLSVAVQKLTHQSINYVACFVPRGKTSTDLPRILVQWQPWPEPPPSYEAVDEVLGRELPGAMKKVESSLPIKVEGLEAGSHYIDRAKNRLVMRLRASVPGVGTVEGVSFGMFGKKGMVLLHCYNRRERFGATLPLFEQFADTFHFDPGLEYKPDPNAAAAKSPTAAVTAARAEMRNYLLQTGLSPIALGGIAGGAVGLLTALAQLLRRGSSRPPAPTGDEWWRPHVSPPAPGSQKPAAGI